MAATRVLNITLDQETYLGFTDLCANAGVTAAALIEAFARNAITEDIMAPTKLPSLPRLVQEARVIAAERRRRR